MTVPFASQRKDAESIPALHDRAPEARKLRILPVLALALALRVLAVGSMFRSDPRVWFYDQASELTCLAHSLLAGQGLSSPFGGSTGPSAFLAPAYPLLVALVYRLFGASSTSAAVAITALQILFGILTVLVVMLLANRLFDSRIANIAGLLCAVSPTMVWLPALFWETSLSALLLIGIPVLALRCVDQPSTSNWIAIGAYCACALLVNPALLLTFLAVAAWTSFQTKCTSRRGPLLAAATCALLFAAWPIRNAIQLHAFVPLRSNLGYELWQGNRPGSHGFFTQDLYLNANRGEYAHFAAIGELPYMHEKSRLALAAIKTDPLRFLRLSLKRFGIFWTALGGHGISLLVVAEITLTSVGAITSLFLLHRRLRYGSHLLSLPFLLFPLPYYLTHPDFRFRLLLEPIALLLTAWLLNCGYALLESVQECGPRKESRPAVPDDGFTEVVHQDTSFRRARTL